MSTLQRTSQQIPKTVVRIQAGVWGFVLAALGGLTLFAMTAWLLIKGGQDVGVHLELLKNYFPGYSVSWSGSLVGSFYGILVGGITGWAVGFIYNGVVDLRTRGKGR